MAPLCIERNHIRRPPDQRVEGDRWIDHPPPGKARKRKDSGIRSIDDPVADAIEACVDKRHVVPGVFVAQRIGPSSARPPRATRPKCPIPVQNTTTVRLGRAEQTQLQGLLLVGAVGELHSSGVLTLGIQLSAKEPEEVLVREEPVPRPGIGCYESSFSSELESDPSLRMCGNIVRTKK